MRKIIFIFLCILLQKNSWAQPQPQAMPPYFINNLTLNNTNGIELYQSETIISTGNESEPVNISGSAKVDYKASKEVELKPGFTASDFTGDGEFHAYIDELPFDVAWFEPTTNAGIVPKFEKMEIGIGLKQELQDKIENYLANSCNTQQDNCINPFNDEEISLEITLNPPSGNSFTKYGFYMKDYQILADGIVAGFLDGYEEVPTNYPWKIRIAPDELGEWSYSVKAFLGVGQTHVQIPGEYLGSFQCSESNNKGFIEVGENSRYLRYSGTHESFFVIGENIESHWLNPIIANNNYPLWLQQLHENGGNYFESYMLSHNIGFEREQLNNYANDYTWVYYDFLNEGWGQGSGNSIMPNQTLNRQMNAWELDRLLVLAKSLDIKVQIQNGNSGTFPYPDMLVGKTPEEIQDVLNSGDGGAWMNNDWMNNCYNTNSLNPNADNEEITDVVKYIDYLTSPMARKFLKKQYRYISSRWGYSTALSTYELSGEADGIFGLKLKHNDVHDVEEASPLIKFQNETYLRNWANDISDYLDELHDPHLITLSCRTGYTPASDETLNDFFVDLINYSWYGLAKNEYHNLEDFIGVIRPEFNNSPFLIGEIGLPEMLPQTRNYFHSNLWGTAFSGAVGAGLNWSWNIVHDPALNYYTDFKPLALFMEGIDFEENNWQPHKSFSIDESVEQFYMTNAEGKQAMGWLHNRSAYWANVWPDCYYETDIDNDEIKERHYCPPDDASPEGQCLNNDFIESISESVYIIEHMLPGTELHVEFFDTYSMTGESFIPVYETVSVLYDGTVYFDAPAMDAAKPDWAFKLWEGPEFRSTHHEAELRDTAVCPNSNFTVQHLLKNFTDNNSPVTWDYNGVHQQGMNPMFTASVSGWDEIKLYTTGHNSDTLTARIYIKDCNQKQPVSLQSQNYEMNYRSINHQKYTSPDFEGQNSSGITAVNKHSIRVYPVPSSGFINIDVVSANSEQRIYKVYNVLGELVFEKASIQNHITLDLSNAAKGVYILMVIEPNNSISNYKLEIQ